MRSGTFWVIVLVVVVALLGFFAARRMRVMGRHGRALPAPIISGASGPGIVPPPAGHRGDGH